MDDFDLPGVRRRHKLPYALLPYLPALRWRVLSALIVIAVIIGVIVFQQTQLSRIESRLDSHEREWDIQNIENYEFYLEYSHHDFYFKSRVVVQNGNGKAEVINSSGDTGNRIGRNDITMSNVFYFAYDLSDTFSGYDVKIDFDDEYGFPSYVEVGAEKFSGYCSDCYPLKLKVEDFKILE